jgi:Fe2+ or Zn2+ uptake regulation protein
MPRTKKVPRRPLRELVTDALHGVDRLTTAKLHQKVTELSGKKYSAAAMYNTLRQLAKEKTISATRAGHQKIYSLGRTVKRDLGKVERAVIPDHDASSSMATAQSGPGHKLAMGEIAIVHSDGESVVSATNVHGELVLKRHKVPPT